MRSENIGANVRRLRESKGLTQDGLAASMGVTKAWISQVESGTSRPNVERLIELATRLGTTTDELLRP